MKTSIFLITAVIAEFASAQETGESKSAKAFKNAKATKLFKSKSAKGMNPDESEGGEGEAREAGEAGEAEGKSMKSGKAKSSKMSSTKSKVSKSKSAKSAPPLLPAQEVALLASKAVSSFYKPEDNSCNAKKVKLDNFLCVDIEVQPQAGANITMGYVGLHEVGPIKPNTKEYYESNMCPVNVHWHLGTEHYSVGEFDEGGDGPHGNVGRPDWAARARALAGDGEVQAGFRCHHYDEDDTKFTMPYEWKHCEGMEVGETYEVHWPHSSAGACGTVDQYQTPFYDGVFCNLSEEVFGGLTKQAIASNVGVHGQVFTIVNDESYFYSDMIRGMIVDGEMGKDVTYYTGSTTGDTRSNEMCSAYAPITWQVDRKCHQISASSFDKMCYDMKMQRDDMSGDLHPHGARELVKHDYAADNHVFVPGGERKNIRG